MNSDGINTKLVNIELYEKKYSQETSNKKVSLSPTSEINLFCKIMTKKAGYQIKTLKQALEFIDNYIPEENKLDSTQSDSSNSEEFEDQIHQLTTDNNTLRKTNTDLVVQKELLEKRVASLQSEVFNLQKQASSSNSSSKKEEIMSNYINQLTDQINTQIEEISKITNQRNSLVKLLQRQNQIIEKIFDTKVPVIQVVHKEEPKPTVNEIKSDDNHFILAKISNNILKSLPYLSTDITKITDLSNKSVIERILLMISTLIEKIKDSEKDNDKINELNEELAKEKQKSFRILTVLEEEMKFLITTSGSEALQKALFFEKPYTGPVMVDNSCRKEILRRSTNVAKFIERNNIKIDENEIITDETMDYTTQIFKLFSPKTLQEQINNFMIREEKPDDNTRELFCLYTASVVMGNVLLSFTTEEQQRNAIMRKEILNLREEMDKSVLEYNQLKTFNKSVIKSISKLPTFDKNLTISENVRKISLVYQENEINKSEIQSLKEENAQSALNIADLNKQVKAVSNEKVEIEISFQNKLNEINEKLSNTETELKEKQLQVQEFSRNVENLEKVRDTQNEIIEQKRNKLADLEIELEQLKVDLTNLNADLKKEKTDNENLLNENSEMKQKSELQNTDIAELKTNLLQLKLENEKSQKYIQNQCKTYSIATNTSESNQMQPVFDKLNEYEQELSQRLETIVELEQKVTNYQSEVKFLKEKEEELKVKIDENEKLKAAAGEIACEAKNAMQWRLWANRLLSIFDQDAPNDKELRLAIEQHALEPSVPGLTKQKIQILRLQKRILSSHEKLKLIRSNTPMKMRSIAIATHFCTYLSNTVCNESK
ncbi:hypothetical protein TVAG_037040 [Trichomonas vaginalis G3]|uniref:Uncharacterized protein n=1 Tax=Trichomonas vaginalis (strain ATCC PRA-98 / G3) TaxID=412133 RepID=A2FH46_TRIV3|nr:hypothetical protein TVAGG3_0470360 [Trichomonas vaginalis G3]EAX95771.1 hypothetical protein TVAG_037040 [Trichomonas vaginalis G3]KAI5515010.1 hypothetical protein TVAGG3_0470360 [Trichomonas vaginalis G3]|eukprot:XP_001308701.1 hypothetical protein [Trichomonas vaginalis G3]